MDGERYTLWCANFSSVITHIIHGLATVQDQVSFIFVYISLHSDFSVFKVNFHCFTNPIEALCYINFKVNVQHTLTIFQPISEHKPAIPILSDDKGVMLDTNHRWISNKVCPTLPSSTIPSIPKVHSYFHHISDTPPFIPVPLVSPFIPMFPVSLIFISMPL